MPGLPRDLLYAGLAGNVVALDRATGAERWRTRLTRTTTVMLTSDDEHIYATALGEAFCLDPVTGHILWRNPLKRLGYGIATLLSSTGQESGPALRNPSRGSQA